MRRLILAAAGLALLVPVALAQVPPGGDDGLPPPPPPPHGKPGRGPGMPPPPPSRAAHFRLERGDVALDVKCSDDDTTRGCADIVAQMIDKLAALPAGAAPPPPAPAPRN